jgi:hypothetical protein
MGHQRRIATVVKASGQQLPRPSRRSASRSNRAATPGRRHLFAKDGWKIEGKMVIIGHGECGKSVVRVEDRLDNELLHHINRLRYACQSKFRPGMNIPG